MRDNIIINFPRGKRTHLKVLFKYMQFLSWFHFRPQWEKCGRYIEGGEERWKELSKDKGSNDLVDVLLAEMTGTDIALIQAGAGTAEEFFEGQVSFRNILFIEGNSCR